MKKYFVYGTLRKQGGATAALLMPGTYKFLGKYVLHGYKLMLSYGYATIVPDENSSVVGELIEIEDQCENRLDIYEGYPTFYDKRESTVVNGDKSIVANVYFQRELSPDASEVTGGDFYN